jgi:hypothetical protein
MDAGVRIRPLDVALRGQVDDIGVLRVDADVRDLLRVLQADVRPGGSGISRLVDTVAMRDVVADRRLAYAHEVHVRIGPGHRYPPTDEVLRNLSAIGFHVAPPSVVLHRPLPVEAYTGLYPNKGSGPVMQTTERELQIVRTPISPDSSNIDRRAQGLGQIDRHRLNTSRPDRLWAPDSSLSSCVGARGVLNSRYQGLLSRTVFSIPLRTGLGCFDVRRDIA